MEPPPCLAAVELTRLGESLPTALTQTGVLGRTLFAPQFTPTGPRTSILSGNRVFKDGTRMRIVWVGGL